MSIMIVDVFRRNPPIRKTFSFRNHISNHKRQGVRPAVISPCVQSFFLPMISSMRRKRLMMSRYSAAARSTALSRVLAQVLALAQS